MTREQQRARQAFEDVNQILSAGEEMGKRYATVVYQAIILIRTAGAVQALEFLNGLSERTKKAAADQFLKHLARQVSWLSSKIQDADSLRAYARGEATSLHQYMLLSREMLAALVWYRRFVQSVLKIDPTAAQDEEG